MARNASSLFEMLIKGAPRYSGPCGDRFHAHLNVAQLGRGLGDRGQDAFPLVGRDETGQQPVPAARQLMRGTPGLAGPAAPAAAGLVWLSHGHLAADGRPGADGFGCAGDYCIRCRS